MDAKRCVHDAMSRPVITVAPQSSAEHAAWLLAEHSIGALPVLDDARQVVGIVTEGDLLAPGALRGRSVADMMTAPVLTLTESSTMAEARLVMEQTYVGRLPVVDTAGCLTGILSRRDVLAAELPSDTEIRRRVIDRVIDLGGEVYTAACERGAVEVRARVGMRSEVAMAEQAIRALDGVARLDARFAYTVDDCREPAHG